MLLAAIVMVAVLANPGVAFAADTTGTTNVHHPPLLDCTPARARPADDDRAFRFNLASALVALPSAAAAARNGFATRKAGRAGRHRAFARGVCFGANRSSSARACRACMSAAAEDVTSGCSGANSRRAAVWRGGCFLAYADSKASSAREHAFRRWFYAGPTTPATLASGECLRGSAVVCDRCFEDSARAAAKLGWLQRIRGEEVVMVGYTCVLRVRISVLPQGPEAVPAADDDGGDVVFGVWMHFMLGIAAGIVAILFFFIIKTVRALPQVNG
ncbi:hypothetical protein EJB05_56832, partial [Eragrostis curvula]